MKKKYADFPNWPKVDEKKYKNMYVNNSDFKGNISLLTAVKVKEPYKKFALNDDKEEMIFDDNFSWLEFYPEDNKNIAFSASFNSNNELLHWYFDIAKDSNLTEEGIPYIDDLYLDLMFYKSGRYEYLDEDELKEALDNGYITKDEYDLAYKVAEKIINKIDGRIDKLEQFSYKYYNLLKEEN